MSRNFYSELRGFQNFLELTDDSNYAVVPYDWCLVVADVQDSTQAILSGRYRIVNMVGASVLASILNSLDTKDIPFVFGGDGATALIPPDSCDLIAKALSRSREIALREHGLNLRIGVIPHRDLLARGEAVSVARFRLSKNNSIAFFRGRALELAENLVKSGLYVLPAQESPPEFDPHKGLSCRWAPLHHRRGMILSVLVKFRLGTDKSIVKEILDRIDQIVDLKSNVSSPVQFEVLKTKNVWQAIWLEMSLKSHSSSFLRLIRTLFLSLILLVSEVIFVHLIDRYKRAIGSQSDYKKFDEVLRMVIDCSPEMRDRLVELLTQYHAEGHLYFGIHESSDAIMTCFVQDLEDNHIHFIDGGSGGYALAAQAMKEQVAQNKVASP